MQYNERIHDELVRKGKHVLDYRGECQTCRAAALRLRQKRAA